MTDRVRITVDGNVADVRLTRADKMNALDAAMFSGIIAAIDQLAGMREVRCAVLSGEGRAFCAGLDMASMATGGASGRSGSQPDLNDAGRRLPDAGMGLAERSHGIANRAQQVAWGWRTLPMPVIAAVHGVAFGGGFQILSGADIRIAHPDTRLSIRESYWGLVPDMAGPALWRTLARDDVLRELTYTGREFSAEEALGYGFVTRIADDPHAAAMALAREIAARSPDATRAAKRLYNLAADADAAAVLQAETDEQVALMGSPNQVEAVKAGMAKRAGTFAD